MSEMQKIIDGIDINRKNPKRDDLWNFIKVALSEIRNIDAFYAKYFESTDPGKKTFLDEIEIKIENLLGKYKELNEIEEETTKQTKIARLEAQIEEIRSYHNELITGENSIKTDIKDSQKTITEFYNFLFSESEEGKGDDNETRIKGIIDDITLFYEKFNPTEEEKQSYKKEIETFYNEFFGKEAGNKSRIESVKDEIQSIGDYYNGDYKKQKVELQASLENSRTLLYNSTGGSLVQGYLESKSEYKDVPQYKKISLNFTKKGINFWGLEIGSWIFGILTNILLFLKSVFVITLYYIFFIAPLIVLMIIFISPDGIANFIGKVDISTAIKDLSFFNRLLISLPFWWIAWFGQHSISQKRRLAEEYNHKAQVVKMYLNFTTTDKYPIEKENIKAIQKELIEVIKRRPGDIYGKDESFIDKFVKIFARESKNDPETTV